MENKSLRGYTLVENPDIFVSGLSGSGKDTISNYVKEYFGYRKMRIADTIKRVISERRNMTFDEIEETKRLDESLRLEHQQVGRALYPENEHLNRCAMLVKRTALDYDIVDDPEKPIIITDVRSGAEAAVFLDNDGIGLFLTRIPTEFTTNHWTDKTMFTEQEWYNPFTEQTYNCIPVVELIKHFPERIYIINNGGIDLSFLDEYLNIVEIVQFEMKSPTGEQLLEVVEEAVLSKIIKR